MNKYLPVPSKVIDLHGFTMREAEVILQNIFSSNDNFKTYKQLHVRIITGKGTNSTSGPVLRDFVKKYLQRNNVKFNQSKIQDGGEGSLEVFL